MFCSVECRPFMTSLPKATPLHKIISRWNSLIACDCLLDVAIGSCWTQAKDVEAVRQFTSVSVRALTSVLSLLTQAWHMEKQVRCWKPFKAKQLPPSPPKKKKKEKKKTSAFRSAGHDANEIPSLAVCRWNTNVLEVSQVWRKEKGKPVSLVVELMDKPPHWPPQQLTKKTSRCDEAKFYNMTSL